MSNVQDFEIIITNLITYVKGMQDQLDKQSSDIDSLKVTLNNIESTMKKAFFFNHDDGK